MTSDRIALRQRHPNYTHEGYIMYIQRESSIRITPENGALFLLEMGNIPKEVFERAAITGNTNEIREHIIENTNIFREHINRLLVERNDIEVSGGNNMQSIEDKIMAYQNAIRALDYLTLQLNTLGINKVNESVEQERALRKKSLQIKYQDEEQQLIMGETNHDFVLRLQRRRQQPGESYSEYLARFLRNNLNIRDSVRAYW